MAVLLLLPAASGCSEIAYYGHLLRGEARLLDSRVPIPQVLADPQAAPALKARLRLVQQARRFSVDVLKLPDNGSYTVYADLHRQYAVWNVFAAPEFSLQGHEWCYPLVGCLQYRGFYDEARAKDAAEKLKGEGLDVYVGGVAAFSTLGWFDDPVLNTMLAWSDDQLIDTVFHELAHQRLFVKGDTAFNESFASFVGDEGLKQFRASRREPPPDPAEKQRRDQFIALVMDARERLQRLYAMKMVPVQMREAKAAEFEALRARYAALKKSWDGYGGYDAWFAGELNNAKLLPIGLYQQWQPAFAALYEHSGRDWPKFYEAAKALGRLDADERAAKLRAFLKSPSSVRPGQPMTAHWGVPDSAAAEGSDEGKRRAFRDAYLTLRRRIELFASLPLEKLDRLALQKQVAEIGRR